MNIPWRVSAKKIQVYFNMDMFLNYVLRRMISISQQSNATPSPNPKRAHSDSDDKNGLSIEINGKMRHRLTTPRYVTYNLIFSVCPALYLRTVDDVTEIKLSTVHCKKGELHSFLLSIALWRSCERCEKMSFFANRERMDNEKRCGCVIKRHQMFSRHGGKAISLVFDNLSPNDYLRKIKNIRSVISNCTYIWVFHLIRPAAD